MTHSFVPPPPGPTWVAYQFGIPIGTVILYGILVGLPTAIISGIFLGGKIANRIDIDPPEIEEAEEEHPPSFWTITGILLLPIILIVAGSLVEQSVGSCLAAGLTKGDRGDQLKDLMMSALAWQHEMVFF